MTFSGKELKISAPMSSVEDSTNDNSEDNVENNLDVPDFFGSLHEKHQDLVEQTRKFGNDYEPSPDTANSPVADEVLDDVSFEPDDLDFGDSV